MADLKSTTMEDNYPDENAPRHRCCCNKVHVILGTKIMATLGIVIRFLALGIFIRCTAVSFELCISIGATILANKPLTIASIVLDVIEIPATFLVFLALQKRREAFLIPVLVVQCLKMVRLLATFVMGVVYIGQHAIDINSVVTYLQHIMLIKWSIEGALFLISSFFVYFHCYQFLKAKNQWTRSNQLALRDLQVQPDSLENSPLPVYAEAV